MPAGRRACDQVKQFRDSAAVRCSISARIIAGMIPRTPPPSIDKMLKRGMERPTAICRVQRVRTVADAVVGSEYPSWNWCARGMPGSAVIAYWQTADQGVAAATFPLISSPGQPAQGRPR